MRLLTKQPTREVIMAERIVLHANRKNLTQDLLKEYLKYDSETGFFFWIKKPSRSIKVGSKAGGLDRDGYVVIGMGGKNFFAHRLAWLYVYGDHVSGDIDHVNMVTTDNRISNLRVATRTQNQQNQREAHSHNKSGLLGAFGVHGASTYMARIVVNGKKIRLGNYPTAKEAHEAYMKAKKKFHEFAVIPDTPATPTSVPAAASA